MNKRETVKLISGIIIGSGIGTITRKAVDKIAPKEELGTFTSLTVFVGGMALSMYVAERSAETMGEFIDNIAELFDVKESRDDLN